MEGLKDLLALKTLHWFSYLANVCWILLGIILSAVFLDTENSEPRFDFHCSSDSDDDKLIGGSKTILSLNSWVESQLQTIWKTIQPKFGIPMYGFVIINNNNNRLFLLL